MATFNKDNNRDVNQGQQAGGNVGQMQQQQRQGHGDLGSPISNDAYNVIAALHEKLQGLEAYRKFAKDGDQHIWQQLSQVEHQSVGLLCDELERLVKDGKFRMQQGVGGKTIKS